MTRIGMPGLPPAGTRREDDAGRRTSDAGREPTHDPPRDRRRGAGGGPFGGMSGGGFGPPRDGLGRDGLAQDGFPRRGESAARAGGQARPETGRRSDRDGGADSPFRRLLDARLGEWQANGRPGDGSGNGGGDAFGRDTRGQDTFGQDTFGQHVVDRDTFGLDAMGRDASGRDARVLDMADDSADGDDQRDSAVVPPGLSAAMPVVAPRTSEAPQNPVADPGPVAVVLAERIADALRADRLAEARAEGSFRFVGAELSGAGIAGPAGATHYGIEAITVTFSAGTLDVTLAHAFVAGPEAVRQAASVLSRELGARFPGRRVRVMEEARDSDPVAAARVAAAVPVDGLSALSRWLSRS